MLYDVVKSDLNLSQGQWFLNWASLTASSLPELSKESQTHFFQGINVQILDFLLHSIQRFISVRRCAFLPLQKEVGLLPTFSLTVEQDSRCSFKAPCLENESLLTGYRSFSSADGFQFLAFNKTEGVPRYLSTLACNSEGDGFTLLSLTPPVLICL